MIILYLYNFLRTILIIIGVIVVLRLIGRMMIAKRNLEEQERMQRDFNRSQKNNMDTRKNLGKTTISRIDKRKLDDSDFVEFEEIED